MPAPILGGLAPELALPAGFVIRLTALDPGTGAVVSGVKVSNVSFYVRDVSGADDDTEAPLPLLVPVAG